jgi:hypothetical protein
VGYTRSSKTVQLEDTIQKAVRALENREFTTVGAAASHFKVSRHTLGRRMAGGKSRAQARELRQLLSNAEEKTLVRWVTRYTMAGSPLSPSLLIELAELIQRHRVRRVSGNEAAAKTITSIGHEWLYRFLNRHPMMRGIYARQMENARFNGATYEVVKSWFDAVASLILEHSYDLRDIWNMDESGFGIGDSQNTRVIVPIKFNHKNNAVPGKQEWVTDIECINAVGEALSPLLIFKAKNLNSGWLPAETPPDWHFGVSENGWTSNDLGLHWLMKVFEPQTRREGEAIGGCSSQTATEVVFEPISSPIVWRTISTY